MSNTDEYGKKITIPGLPLQVSEEFAQEIVEAAVTVFGEAGSPIGEKLKLVIRRRIVIPGFRAGRADRAKPFQIRRTLTEHWTNYQDLACAVLEAWGEQHDDLIATCAAWIQQHWQNGKLELLKEGQEDGVDSEKTERQTLDMLVTGVMEQKADLGTEEQVRLAIMLIIKDFMESKEETDETEMEEQVQEDGNLSLRNENEMQDNQKWEELLEWIRHIPAEDGCWHSLDALLDAIQAIAAAKQIEREHAEVLHRLDQALDEQRHALVDGADYFQIRGVDSWTAAGFSPDQATEVLNELTALLQLLQDFKRHDYKRPATWVERRTWEEDLRRLEEQILSSFRVLQDRFLGVTKPELDVGLPTQSDLTQEQIDSGEIQEQQVSLPEGLEQKDESIIETIESEGIENSPIGVEPSEHKPEDTGEREAIEDNLTSPIETLPNTLDPEIVDRLVNESQTDGQPREESESLLPCQQECDLVTRYLVENRLPTAYWLSWGLEKLGRPGCAPSWLIAAAQGALWHLSLWPELPMLFAESICEQAHPDESQLTDEHDALAWLNLAIGVYMNLTDSSVRWESWLDVPQSNIPYNVAELVRIVRDAKRIGVYLDPLVVRMITDTEAVEKHLHELSEQAKEWLQQAPTRGAHILRAAQVWQSLVRSPNGELYKLVQEVAADHRSRASEILSQLERWRDRSWLDKQIQKIDRELNGRKNRPIVGRALDQIIGWVSEITKTIEQYCHVVLRSAKEKPGEDWTVNQVQKLCRECSQVMDGARQEIHDLIQATSNVVEKVGLQLANRLFDGLTTVVSLEGYSALSTFPQPPFRAELQGIRPDPTLIDQLAYSLIFYPELDLRNNGLPDPASIEHLVNILETDLALPQEDAVRGWIAKHDFRFIPTLLVGLENRELWEIRVSEALRSDMQRLENEDINETVITVEQALLEGIIAEAEHTDFRSQIESVYSQLRKTERDSSAGISVRNLSRQLEEIRSRLQEKRQERLKNQRNHWEKTKEKVSRVTGGNQELTRRIEQVVEQSLQEQDLRAAGEYLAHLEDVLNGVKALTQGLFETHPAKETDIVLEFQATLPSLIHVLDEPRSRLGLGRIGEMLLNDKPISGFPMPRLPRSRLDEIARALAAWRKLKKLGQNQDQQANLPLVADLMSYLGFNLPESQPVSIASLPGELRNFQHWRVIASAGEFSPVAQFGSQRDGFYDVIGIWERPGFEIISSQVNLLMKETGNKPTILFYFGRLLPAQREDLLSITHKGVLPMLVVDEALILFLTRLYDTRLKPMFHCTLPYAALNPFFPAAAGLVPPEVFKGRNDLKRNLIEPLGPAIVYGGRQLGKSALLRQVQREFHRPENNQYAIYEDIKLIGDPASGKNYQADLHDRLVMALANEGLVKRQHAAHDLDRFLNQIQQKVNDEKLRVLLLLDETDHFLDADAEKNFYLIQKLKNLMDQTDRRFKVVLAGLHNVQRFQRIPNQPLAHLATGSIEIGPLDPEPALELLVEPLHALGYRFGEDSQVEDISLVLHILSYTNYHPGLIQLFGSYLVEHLQSKYQQPCRLPLYVSRSDVEAVYRKKEVRDAISERFNWTLALDPRYEAITLALILEQWNDQNGFDRLYTPKELQDVASVWWPEAFGDEINDDQFKGFLDEMRGLGVLSINPGGNYRLRSPNLVSLMGTHDQIWKRLDVLVQSTPPGERALENYHALIEGEDYSPLSFMQERVLNNSRSGVALIFGSPAVGILSLDRALQRLVPEGTGAWREIRIAARNANAIRQQLSSFIKDKSTASFLVAYRELDGNPDELVDQVMEAVRYCQQIRNRTLRVCFAFDPSTTWQWFQLSKERRKSIEEQVAVIVPLKRWDRLGIKQRLEMEPWNGDEVIVSDPLLSKALDITGGWPFLLDEFFHRKDGPNPRTALEEFHLALHDPESTLRRNFMKSLSIYDPPPRQIIKALLDADISKMIQEGEPYVEVLSLELRNLPAEKIENGVEYLKRMAIVTSDTYPVIEPVLAQLWHEA